MHFFSLHSIQRPCNAGNQTISKLSIKITSSFLIVLLTILRMKSRKCNGILSFHVHFHYQFLYQVVVSHECSNPIFSKTLSLRYRIFFIQSRNLEHCSSSTNVFRIILSIWTITGVFLINFSITVIWVVYFLRVYGTIPKEIYDQKSFEFFPYLMPSYFATCLHQPLHIFSFPESQLSIKYQFVSKSQAFNFCKIRLCS